MQASNYIQAIEERQGLMVALPRGDRASAWATSRPPICTRLAQSMGSSAYGQYLLRILEQEA